MEHDFFRYLGWKQDKKISMINLQSSDCKICIVGMVLIWDVVIVLL